MSHTPVKQILDYLAESQVLKFSSGDLPAELSGITDDSRRVKPGYLFVAVRGGSVDGHTFLQQARDRGAAAAIVEHGGSEVMPSITVSNSARAAALASAAFYGFPARKLRVVGVTGTNGKTTTVHILRHLLTRPDRLAASVGTLGVLVGSAGNSAPGISGEGLTTPGGIQLAEVMRALVDSGVSDVAMEVSSHSLDQHRVDGIEFSGAAFTNLSRDHIDYHGTMEAYFSAKARLVDLVAPEAPLVVNADDAIWNQLQTSDRRVARFSVNTLGRSGTVGSGDAIESADVDIFASEITYSESGSIWTLGVRDGETRAVHLPLIGAFNVSNAVAAASLALSLGETIDVVADRLSTVPQVPGRMERLNSNPVVLRDYSHTPDALERALIALRPFAPNGICVVFGCGGDRDRGKRPVMGGIAARLADRVILTSDNPRTEDPEAILDDIAAGISGTGYDRIEERRAAIKKAIDSARNTGELVLLAGKGHETYQIRGTEKLHFDEKEIVEELTRSVK